MFHTVLALRKPVGLNIALDRHETIIPNSVRSNWLKQGNVSKIWNTFVFCIKDKKDVVFENVLLY